MNVYRSTGIEQQRDAANAAAARALLAAHVPEQNSNRCVVCRVHGPCRSANAAANRLVELGQPIPPPTESRPWFRARGRAVPTAARSWQETAARTAVWTHDLQDHPWWWRTWRGWRVWRAALARPGRHSSGAVA